MGDEDKVVITIKDIYKELTELVVEVRNLTTQFATGRSVDEDHEKRIRSLERWMYAIPASLVVAIVSAVITLKG